MSLLTDQEKQDIAEAVVHMSFDINYAESIAHVCELAEAAVIARLATVIVEPVAYVSEDELGYVEGGGRCGAFYGVMANAELKDDPDFVAVYTGSQLAAERVQALEEAAKICECQWSTLEERDAGIEFAEAIRALIGGPT